MVPLPFEKADFHLRQGALPPSALDPQGDLAGWP